MRIAVPILAITIARTLARHVAAVEERAFLDGVRYGRRSADLFRARD